MPLCYQLQMSPRQVIPGSGIGDVQGTPICVGSSAGALGASEQAAAPITMAANASA